MTTSSTLRMIILRLSYAACSLIIRNYWAILKREHFWLGVQVSKKSLKNLIRKCRIRKKTWINLQKRIFAHIVHLSHSSGKMGLTMLSTALIIWRDWKNWITQMNRNKLINPNFLEVHSMFWRGVNQVILSGQTKKLKDGKSSGLYFAY